jgi:hypothetical protein
VKRDRSRRASPGGSPADKVLTFFHGSERIIPQREAEIMKDFFKGLCGILLVATAFFVGFKLGKSKEKSKIPNFQEDI